MTKWLVANTQNVEGGKVEYSIPERPLLHCCSNKDDFNGDKQVTRLDIDPQVKPDIVADVREPLPVPKDYYAVCFADFPWVEKFRFDAAKGIKHMLEVAPIVYTICPWLYGARTCYPDAIQVSWRPGINHPILFTRYVRRE